MKFNRKELGTQKQFNELNLYLSTEKINENPLDTAKVILNIALKFRISSDFYSENITFLKKVVDFAEYHQNNIKILENCINAIGEFGGLSKNNECKEFCFNYLKNYAKSDNKKIKYISNLLIVNLYAELLHNEPDFFQFAIGICNLAPKKNTIMIFSIFISVHIDWFDKMQLQQAINVFDKYSKATKHNFDKFLYEKIAELLNQHINKNIKLKSKELRSKANDYAINKTYK